MRRTGLLLCLLISWACAAATPPAQPDIVVFISDDLGKLDCEPYGGGGIRTPHLRGLAAAGLTFDRAFVVSPSCAPSRAALLTGLMPARNGATANHSRPRADLRKWPAYFQELGYEVAAFGKVAHYKQANLYGFDTFAHDTFHDPQGIPAAISFLQRRPRAGAKPLCLFVGSNWPHVPWPSGDARHQPETLMLPAGGIDTPATRQWRAKYADAVGRADDELGLVLQATKERLGPGVLFLFSSDNGAQWPFGKWNVYEAGVATPLIVAWPGVVAPSKRTEAMVSWVDLLPTLLEAAGGKAPVGIDGRSFLPVLKNPTATHRDYIFATHDHDTRMNVYPSRSIRNGRWKYIRNLHPDWAFTTHIDLVGARGAELGQRDFFATWEQRAQTDPAAAAVVRRYHAREAEELYDLAADPAELQNLAHDPKAQTVLGDLRTRLDAWMKEQGDAGLVPVAPRLLTDPDSFGPGGAAAEAKKAR